MTKQQINNFKEANNKILAFNKDELINRPEWGSINFEKSKKDFERIFWISEQLNSFNIDSLPEQILQKFTQNLNDVVAQIEPINKFSLNNSNPSQTRDGLVNNLHNSTENLFIQCAPWLPFLAHQKGDVAKNIEKLSTSTTEADAILSTAKKSIEKKTTEIDNIIQTAREASAGAGAAVFTKDFEYIAKEQDDASFWWLVSSIILTIITLVITGLLFYSIETTTDSSILIQKLSIKLFGLALLLTVILWCGKNYKALRHLSTITNIEL